jgi:general stress protein 26
MIDKAGKLELYRFLTASRYGVLSTVADNGAPEAALVGFAATPDLELIFETIDTTRKYANIRRNPRVAAVIGWEGEKTLQYEGIADEPDESAVVELKKTYFAILPENANHDGWPGLTYMRIRPRWIRLSNYGKPWSIEEFHFER